MVRRGVYFESVDGPAPSIRYLMEPRLWQDRIGSLFRHCSSFHLNRLQISEYRLIMLYKKKEQALGGRAETSGLCHLLYGCRRVSCRWACSCLFLQWAAAMKWEHCGDSLRWLSGSRVHPWLSETEKILVKKVCKTFRWRWKGCYWCWYCT